MDRGRNAFQRRKSRWENTDQHKEKPVNSPRSSPNTSMFSELENKKVDDRVRKRKTKHPRNLKGKDIGLYYASLSKDEKHARVLECRRRKVEEMGKILAKIVIADKKRKKLRALINTIKGFNTCYLSKGISSVKDSEFKREFLSLINGSFDYKLRINLRKELEPYEPFDTIYYNTHEKNSANIAVKNMLTLREKLPCYSKKDEILELIKNNQVVVICGETGCGKTTQIPQFILDDYIINKKGSQCSILCTQPRRISAISVAERVAAERGEKCGRGSSIGFHIRLEKKLPRDTGSIIYCTTGILLKLMETNPSLSSFSHIVLDEIHERDVTSDFVLTVMKMVISVRSDIKLILMSATLNAERFSKYYNNCPIITIPGFTFPVEVFYLEDALAKTKYDFEPYHEATGWKRHLKLNKEKKQAAEELTELMGPYVRDIRAKKKYSTRVCNNLLNPNSEKPDYKLIVELIKYICSTSENSASILVFVPGFYDICRIVNTLTESKHFSPSKYLIISLHSKLPSIEQRQVFEKPSNGMRKIVIATNIAETSITIDDIVYVIDTGRIKMKSYDVLDDLEALRDEWVSVANANQRKGRAGRVQAGVCYHLFSRPRFFQLESYPTPEIQRTRLENVLLTIKILQLGDIRTFVSKLMDPPNWKAVENAIKLLKQMNALDKIEQLTPLGYHLAKLPVHPRVGKMILLGALFSCLDPILSIAASLDFKDAFQYPIDKQNAVNAQKYKLLSGWNSDHLVLAEAIRQYEIEKAKGQDKEFCWEYFLSRGILELLCKMKDQFAEYLYDMKFISNKGVKSREWNRNSQNFSLIKAIVCAGLYPNVAIISKVNRKGVKIVRTTQHEKVVINPNSVNSLEKKFSSPLLVYHLKQKLMYSINLFDTTMVHPLPLIFFGDKLIVEPLKNDNGQFTKKKENYCIAMSKKLRFKCSKDNAAVIRELREKLDDLLLYKITHPGWVSWLDETNPEVKLLNAIMDLITLEDIGDIDIEVDQDLYDMDF